MGFAMLLKPAENFTTQGRFIFQHIWWFLSTLAMDFFCFRSSVWHFKELFWFSFLTSCSLRIVLTNTVRQVDVCGNGGICVPLCDTGEWFLLNMALRGFWVLTNQVYLSCLFCTNTVCIGRSCCSVVVIVRKFGWTRFDCERVWRIRALLHIFFFTFLN